MLWFDHTKRRELHLIGHEHYMKIVGNVQVVVDFRILLFLPILQILDLVHGIMRNECGIIHIPDFLVPCEIYLSVILLLESIARRCLSPR